MSETRNIGRSVRTGTVVWGVILVLVAALSFAARRFELWDLPASFPVLTAVGIGALLVLIGLVGGLVSAARRRSNADEGRIN